MTAYELDPDLVERAAARYPEVTFRLGAAEDTGLADGSFDVVLLLSVLEHTEDPDAVLAEVQRLLRSGGRLALTADSFEGPAWMPERARHASRWNVRHYFGRAEILELVERYGFRVTWSQAILGFRSAPTLYRLRLRGSELHWALAPVEWLAALAVGPTSTGAIVSLVASQDR